MPAVYASGGYSSVLHMTLTYTSEYCLCVHAKQSIANENFVSLKATCAGHTATSVYKASGRQANAVFGDYSANRL